ncbi:MAG: TonB-dependent receptor [Bacteroidales bacterium]
MRLKLLFVSFLFFVSLYAVAQKSSASVMTEEVVHITTPSASVLKWFELIEKKGIILSYNSSAIDLNCIKQIDARNMQVGKLLKEVLSDYKLKIIPSGTNKLILQVEARKKYNVSGVIREAGTSEKLYGGAITFQNEAGENIVIVSNSNGMYNVRLAGGTYLMEISYIGYRKKTDTITVNQDLFLSDELMPIPYEIKEVSIEPQKGANDLGEIAPSNLLSFNNSDIFSQIRILPGVIGASSNGDLQVNGGSQDENLILLDGIPVYHTGHLNSMLPAFNGDAIKSVGFHKSFFPTQFEGRLSSVTDIKLKEGNKTEHSQTLSLDMPAASAMFEGPVVKNKLSYMVSGRRSWLDFFDNLLSEDNRLNHSFYDFNVKLGFSINKKTSLQALAYKAWDNYYEYNNKEKSSTLKWSNELYALKFNTVYGDKLFNTNTIAYTSYSNRVRTSQLGLEGPEFLKSGIKELTLTSEFSYNVDNVYRAIWGVKGSIEEFNIAGFGNNMKNRYQPISQFSLFYDNRIRITDKLFGQIGVNFVAYMPKHFENYYSVQPRFSFKYNLDDKNLFYAGFSRMAQFYHYMRLDFYFLPTDFQMPSIAGYKPRTSNHYEIGWKYFMPDGLIDISAFYKDRDNTVSFKPGAYPWDSNWTDYIMVGSGKSYGIRMYAHKNWNKFAFQASYAFTRSLEHFPELPDRGYVPALTDVPHVFNTALSYKFKVHSAFSVGALMRSGRMIGNLYDFDILPAEYFRRIRMPFNYRIDASYTYIKELKKPAAKILLRVGLYNILGNPSYEDIMDFYTVVFHQHCLPYGSISVKF